MPDDTAIFKAFSEYVYLTIPLASRILNRGEDTIQRRFNLFAGNPDEEGNLRSHPKYLGRVQENAFGRMLYFLAPTGGQKAASLGLLPEPRWVQKKSGRVSHDAYISYLHFILATALQTVGRELVWEQWYADLKDIIDAAHAIPDARLCVRGDSEYSLLEVVKAIESGHRENEKNLTEKLKSYDELGVYRVYVTMPTVERATNYLKKVSTIVPKPFIWIADEASVERDILGSIWRTPADFKEKTYSILKPTP